GKSWGPQKSGTDKELYNIIFTDSKRGWIVGNKGIILNTENGGIDWISQRIGQP
ncbi:MAG: hypothetical protein HZA09_02395, partial [Nitrospirae bacterium]|nr:hypothetical protein [Nitrospirota bacterium]